MKPLLLRCRGSSVEVIDRTCTKDGLGLNPTYEIVCSDTMLGRGLSRLVDWSMRKSVSRSPIYRSGSKHGYKLEIWEDLEISRYSIILHVLGSAIGTCHDVQSSHATEGRGCSSTARIYHWTSNWWSSLTKPSSREELG
jgi:hypothetical protein